MVSCFQTKARIQIEVARVEARKVVAGSKESAKSDRPFERQMRAKIEEVPRVDWAKKRRLPETTRAR